MNATKSATILDGIDEHVYIYLSIYLSIYLYKYIYMYMYIIYVCICMMDAQHQSSFFCWGEQLSVTSFEKGG